MCFITKYSNIFSFVVPCVPPNVILGKPPELFESVCLKGYVTAVSTSLPSSLGSSYIPLFPTIIKPPHEPEPEVISSSDSSVKLYFLLMPCYHFL